MATDFDVLISSAGRRVRLVDTFREALGRLGLPGRVIAADASPVSAVFHYADAGHVVPRCTAQGFVGTMLDLCQREAVRLVIPTIDPELAVFAENRERFAGIGTVVAVSDPRTVAIGMDKALTHRWLEANGLPTVREATVEEVLLGPGDWAFPVVAKPRAGSSSIGVAHIATPADLRPFAQRDDYLVQERASGQEYTIDLLFDRGGRLVDCVPRRRIETRAGEVSKGITERHEPLMALAARLGAALPGPYGCLNVQVFWDEARQDARIIEINPRFGGGYPLSWAAGAAFSQWMIEDLVGLPVSARPNAWREGLLMLRYDAEVLVADGARLL